MRWIKRFVFFLFLLFVLAICAGLLINWKYGKDIEAYVLESIRSVIVTDIEINENAEFSLWKDFPLVAVELKDIYIQDSFRSDTLLSAGQAFAQLNIFKILSNDFTIEGIRVKDGLLRLKRNEDGEWNFRVWKELKKDDGSKTKTDFSIEVLTLENIYLDYDDRAVDLNIQFLSSKSKIKGRFTNENQRFGLSLKGYMPRLTTIGADRIVELPLELAGVLNINSNEKIYTIEMGNAVLAKNEMVFDAEWRRIEDGTNMNLKVHAGNISPEVLLPHVWPQMPEAIINLQLHGQSDLIVSMTGPFTKTNGPELDAVIRMRNGGLVFHNTSVHDLNLEGKLYMKDVKRSKAIKLNFDSFSLSTDAGSVKGKGTLINLADPYLSLTTKGNSRIEEILSMVNVENGISGNGNIAWNIDFEGPLGKEFKTTMTEFKQMNWSGAIDFSEANIQFAEDIPQMKNLSGKIVMNANETIIEDCNGSVGHISFESKLKLKQLKEVLSDPNYPVDINGALNIQQLDISQLPEEWAFTSKSGSTTKSRPIYLLLQTRIEEVNYQSFIATDVIGILNIQDENVLAQNLNFKALGGSVNADLSFSPSPTGYALSIDGKLKQIDMSQTLREWNNFGQLTITSKHLQGTASATINLTSELSSDYAIDMDRLKVESDIEISNGQLIKFEPLLAMSRFIDVDELNLVKFDTLRNHLTIENSTLTIPRMSVSSSILNVDVFGEHGFNQEMDYHVNLLLNDLIRRKAKKKKTFDGHEIIDETGKTRLFLWIRGKPGDLKVGFDKREVRKKVKADMKAEGQTIKRLFKEEFGGQKKEPENEDQIQFKIEEDITSPTEIIEDKPELKDNQKKKRGLFSSEPEQEETEGGFEIEFDP